MTVDFALRYSLAKRVDNVSFGVDDADRKGRSGQVKHGPEGRIRNEAEKQVDSRSTGQ